ncbi:GCG_CRPN prefix-to-repeats domain-containing protein [Mesorhizobium sp. INR15]|uniref:GCG_CRPN prefix-to-repeats domain-containing protein n=1 Tax=Mesorhizobium sp. INR15 TaxID=2654248 RepID=UPI0018969628|nr:hypothetical protein [Mesorhizobium sp. INR15]QPC89182.1 hypothetical protein GA829_00455 [Mesorhizobium sp. INR15]
MNRLTKYAIAAALAVGGTGTTVAASSAMPIVSITQPAGSALVEHVAWGCGRGWHPNHWGRCVPNRVVVYPGFYVGPRPIHVWHRHHWHHWRRW